MNAMVEALRDVPLFADFSNRDLRRVADSMQELSFARGKEVVTEGKGGVGFFVILDGSARVTQHGEDRGLLGAGDYFGEMALIDGNDRVASVHAETELRCGVMSPWTFRPFVREHPDVAWSLLTALVKRLRETRVAQGAAAG
jgi:CRP-like cAMP-binding protein